MDSALDQWSIPVPVFEAVNRLGAPLSMAQGAVFSQELMVDGMG
jgi:hypothetical protein